MQTYWQDDWIKTCKKRQSAAEHQVGDFNPQIPKHFHNSNPPPTLSYNQRSLTVEHDSRKEGKERGTRYQSEVCSQRPVAGRHAVLNEAAAQTISSLHSVISHGEVRTSLTTWPVWLILSYHIVYPHRSQTNRPHTCLESRSLMTPPQAESGPAKVSSLSTILGNNKRVIHRFNHIFIWHGS